MIVLILGISTVTVFAEEDDQEDQEMCNGFQESEWRVFQLEQAIFSAELEVPVPDAPSNVVEGEIASCDKRTELVEQRIEQLETYMEENDVDIPDEEEIRDIEDFQKQEKGNDGQIGNDMSASVSKGMPACEEKARVLEQRIHDLEKFIADNDLELPEASEEEQALAEELKEADESAKEVGDEPKEAEGTGEETGEQKQEAPKGFFKGVFKKMFGFFGVKEGQGQQMEQAGEEPEPTMDQPPLEEPKPTMDRPPLEGPEP
ncbi:MAG: hypothetical protein AABX82_04125, partial [Nanoarchaeota archaeon]